MSPRQGHSPLDSGWTARWGREHPPAPGVILRAGHWQARFSAGELVDLRLNGQQIIRRLCVRVRDVDWNTVEGAPSRPRVACSPDEVTVSFESRHRDAEGDIDFVWSGELSGRSDDVIEWTMAGRARHTFDYNRIGICVLLNPDVLAGASYVARRHDQAVSGRIDDTVAPQEVRGDRIFPMVDAFSELEIELRGGGSIRCSFAGDLFEMEDQRNWSDGSLKIYSTPVGDPVPRHARSGEQFVQRVRVALSGANSVPARPAFTSRRRARTTSVRVILGQSGEGDSSLPPLGLGLDTDLHEPTPRELGWLHRLAPAHLRVDVSVGDAGRTAHTLRRADRVASALGAELEVALSMPMDQAQAVPAAVLEELQAPVARLIVLDGAAVTDSAYARRARGILPGVPVVCGTDAYFAECNRERPDLAGADGLAYPLTPQVHDSDEQALVESIGAQAATVRTARMFADCRPIHVSPVTLRPRWNPLGRRPGGGSGRLPAGADHRQPTTLTAAWTVGSIRRLAAADAASLTYYELTGRRGVIYRERESISRQRDLGRPGEPFPVFWVLAEVARLRGRVCFPVEVSDPLSVEALAVRDDDGLVLLVANLRPEPVRIRLEPLDGDRVESRRLDVLGAGWGEPEPLKVRRRVCEIGVASWSVARIATCSAVLP